MKSIIFDSGALISLAMNGLLPELRELRKIFDGNFLITKKVKEELVDKPITTKRFELEAMKIKQLLDDKILELPDSVRISENEISIEMDKILRIANETFFKGRDPIKVIHFGEASCLALSRILDKRKINNIIVIDERTTRVLGEKPENVEKLLERKLHTNINSRRENFKHLQGFRFIRSAELLYVAYKKGVVRIKHKNILDALLYAVKFSGCAISEEEIKEIERIG